MNKEEQYYHCFGSFTISQLSDKKTDYYRLHIHTMKSV